MRTGAVTGLSVEFDYGGPNCPLVGTRIGGNLKKPVRITNRRFRVRAFEGDVFEGRFNSPTKASGTGHFEPSPQDEASCEAADITWRARR